MGGVYSTRGIESSGTDSGTDDGSQTATDPVVESSGATPTLSEGGDCDEFDDEVGEPAVDVVLTNSGMGPIYVTEALDCYSAPMFGLSQSDVDIPWKPGECDHTCGTLAQGQCDCPGACVQDSVVRIDPGASYTTQWPGQVLEAAELSETCAAACGEGWTQLQCNMIRQALAGSYTVTAEAGTERQCDGAPCNDECWETGEGWCRIDGRIGDPTLPGTAELIYPDEGSVEIVF